MSETLRVIGDIHGKYDEYVKLITSPDCDYSLQLGDFGFEYGCFRKNKIDTNRHFFFGGNHDNYDILESNESPDACIGNYGLISLPSHHQFFFIRGAASIDVKYRVEDFIATKRKSWWYQEELSWGQQSVCEEQYLNAKPDVVITHDAPTVFVEKLTNPATLIHFGWSKNMKFQTQMFFQRLWEMHQPKLWICGHYHKAQQDVIEGTHFRCLHELEYADFNPDWTYAT